MFMVTHQMQQETVFEAVLNILFHNKLSTTSCDWNY